jgi:hypothetical protein
VMGVLISLVAIPLRANVPIFLCEAGPASLRISAGKFASSQALCSLCKTLQVIEIPNT